MPPLADALGEKTRDGGAQLRHAGADMRGGHDQIGEGRRPLPHRGLDRLDTFGERGFADLVTFGEHDFVADGRLAQGIKDGIVGGFQAMARIDQHVHTGERGAPVDHRHQGLAGKLVLEREHLRDRLIIQLQLFDNKDKLSFLVSAGANLATDMLNDDMAFRSPQYRRILTDLALTRIQGLPDATWRELAATLARLADQDQVIQEKVRLQVLAALSNYGGARAHATLIFNYLKSRSQMFKSDGVMLSRLAVEQETDYGREALVDGDEVGRPLPGLLAVGQQGHAR